MRLALAQINTVVGDLDGNRTLILGRLDEARQAGAELVLFPELAVTGYPPEDLLLRPGFIRAAAESLRAIAAETKDIVAVVGFPHFDRDLFNACAVCADGGEAVARASGFEEALLVVDLEPEAVIGRRLRDVRRRALAREREVSPPVQVVHVASSRPVQATRPNPRIAEFELELEQMRLALELGLRDYVEKNGFADIVLGVSGGIDSAVTAALAAEALGSDRVHCVSMPSRFTSEGTRSDARRLA